MDNAELTQLMKKVANGDQVAFRTLSNAMSQKIFAMAYRFLSGDRASAEDVTQDVLIKLWQYAPRWEAGGSVQAWISRLTYNASMDVHRSRKNKSEEIPETVSVPETASDTVLQKEYKDILLRAIKSLPERQQEALLLTYFHERFLEFMRAVGADGKDVLQQQLPVEFVGGTRLVPRVLRAQARELREAPVDHGTGPRF